MSKFNLTIDTDNKISFFTFLLVSRQINPNIQGFINQIKHICKIDKYAHYLEMKNTIFAKTWLLYSILIN